jgi:hypothetical protein
MEGRRSRWKDGGENGGREEQSVMEETEHGDECRMQKGSYRMEGTRS